MQGDRGVGESARVEHGPDGPARLDLGAGLLYPVDQLAFVVRLPEDRLQAELTGLPPAQVLQLGERRRSVDLRAARSQQVEIRAVQDEHRCHAASFGSDAKVDPPDVTVVTEFRRGRMLRPTALGSRYCAWRGRGAGCSTGFGSQTGKRHGPLSAPPARQTLLVAGQP